MINAHLATGGSGLDTARIVQEPLADFDADGVLIPVLAAEVPSLDNGGVAEDGLSVTWKLKSDVTWSDGEPFTAEDVKFTHEYAVDDTTTAVSQALFAAVSSVDVVDTHTVKINFSEPTPGWYSVFVGGYSPVLPRHILSDYVGEQAVNAPFNLNPVGTGPYIVGEFRPGDEVTFSANPLFREQDKPYFSTVYLKGGGDADGAARAVLQSGEMDFALNLQVQADILASLESSGTGKVIVTPATSVEKILVNMTDPNTEVDGQRSHLGTPHPFQSELPVREAYALALQRDVIAENLFGPAGAPTSNVLIAPPAVNSPNTTWAFDLTKAAQLLDDAGWIQQDGGVRQKADVAMNIVFQTTINPLRQRIQEVYKQALESIDIPVELKSIESSVFFSSDVGNPDTYRHFYADLQMFADGTTSPFPGPYMRLWYGGSDNIPQQENGWTGRNLARWQNADYDRLYEMALSEMDPSTQADLFIQMNDLVVNDVADIPIVERSTLHGASTSLQNIQPTPWAPPTWDIANWTRAS